MRQRSNLLVLLGIAFFLVGGVIVYLITNDDDDGGSSSPANVQVVVATTDISAGDLASDLIEENKLRAIEVEATQLVPGAIGSLTQLEGATFTQNFAADQQITQVGVQLANNRTFEIPEGFEAIAVQLDFVPGVAAYVSPGDRINLYASISGVRSELLLTNVEVLDVDLTIPPRRGSTTDPSSAGAPRSSTDAVTYLLALRADDIEKVVYITENAESLYASLVPDEAPPAGPTPGRNGATLFDEEPNAAFNG